MHPDEEEFDEEAFAKEIDTRIRELNGLFETALKRDISVQVSMTTREKVPALRLDGVHKQLDKPLILRV
jgi:hypothetical protein